MSRSSRQAEIDAMIAEMMNTAPVVKSHPKIFGEEVDADGAVIVEGVDSEQDEDQELPEDETGCDEQKTSSTTASREHGESSSSTRPQEAESSEQLDDNELPSAEGVMESFVVARKVPISHQVAHLRRNLARQNVTSCLCLQVVLGGHSRAVMCMSIEPAGNRVVTGSLDYFVKFFDFGGMDRFPSFAAR